MSHENHSQNSNDDFSSGTQTSDAPISNNSEDLSGKDTDGQVETQPRKPRNRSSNKVKHVFNNRNMLNSQMQKATLEELKSVSDALNETIKTREEEERLAKEKLEQDRAAAAKLLEQAKAGGIDPAVLAEVFAC